MTTKCNNIEKPSNIFGKAMIGLGSDRKEICSDGAGDRGNAGPKETLYVLWPTGQPRISNIGDFEDISKHLPEKQSLQCAEMFTGFLFEKLDRLVGFIQILLNSFEATNRSVSKYWWSKVVTIN